jgi:hypothetical protein
VKLAVMLSNCSSDESEIRPKPDDSRDAFHSQSGLYPKDYRGLFPTVRAQKRAKKAVKIMLVGDALQEEANQRQSNKRQLLRGHRNCERECLPGEARLL